MTFSLLHSHCLELLFLFDGVKYGLYRAELLRGLYCSVYLDVNVDGAVEASIIADESSAIDSSI